MYRMKCEAEKHCLLAQTIAVLQVLSMAFIYRIVAPPHLHNPHLHYPLQPYMHGRRRSLGLARSRLDPLVFVSAYFSPTAFVLCRFCGSIFFHHPSCSGRNCLLPLPMLGPAWWIYLEICRGATQTAHSKQQKQGESETTIGDDRAVAVLYRCTLSLASGWRWWR